MSALPQSGTARPLPVRQSTFDRTSGFADYTLSGFANYRLSGFDRTATEKGANGIRPIVVKA